MEGLKEKIGNDIYLLGINAKFGDLHELPKEIFPDGVGMIAETSKNVSERLLIQFLGNMVGETAKIQLRH